MQHPPSLDSAKLCCSCSGGTGSGAGASAAGLAVSAGCCCCCCDSGCCCCCARSVAAPPECCVGAAAAAAAGACWPPATGSPLASCSCLLGSCPPMAETGAFVCSPSPDAAPFPLGTGTPGAPASSSAVLSPPPPTAAAHVDVPPAVAHCWSVLASSLGAGCCADAVAVCMRAGPPCSAAATDGPLAARPGVLSVDTRATSNAMRSARLARCHLPTCIATLEC